MEHVYRNKRSQLIDKGFLFNPPQKNLICFPLTRKNITYKKGTMLKGTRGEMDRSHTQKREDKREQEKVEGDLRNRERLQSMSLYMYI